MVRKKAVPKKSLFPDEPSSTKLADLPGDVFAGMGLSRQDAANLARSSRDLRAGMKQSGLLSAKEKRNTLAKRRITQFVQPERDTAVDRFMSESFPPVRVDDRTAMQGARLADGFIRLIDGLPDLRGRLKPLTRRVARRERLSKTQKARGR